MKLRLIFLLWLIVIMFSLSRLVDSHGDIAGWIGESLGFGLPIIGIYYGVQWFRKKRVKN